MCDWSLISLLQGKLNKWQIARDPLHFGSFWLVPNLGSELSVPALMVEYEMNYRVGNGPRWLECQKIQIFHFLNFEL